MATAPRRTEIARCALTVIAILFLGARFAAPFLERREDIPLPGSPVRFDYQSIDPTSRRLYISHMGAGQLVVFDLATGRVQGIVRELPRITGVLAVPVLGKVYASVPGT